MMFELIEDDVYQFIYTGVTGFHLQPDIEAFFIEERKHMLVDIDIATTDVWIIRFTAEAEICAFSIQNADNPDSRGFSFWKFRGHMFANGRPICRPGVIAWTVG